MEHKYTEKAEINFSKLEERIFAVNNPDENKIDGIKNMLLDISCSHEFKPILIMATGGSKVVAYFLASILERLGLNYDGPICHVIEPRDYFYLESRNLYSSLIGISVSGETNGIKEALGDFKGEKYLICQDNLNIDGCKVISWKTSKYSPEKSFISLASSLAPMSLMLYAADSLAVKTTKEGVNLVNEKIHSFLEIGANRANELPINFRGIDKFQIISGADTKAAEYALESTILESGLGVPTVSDKGAFCHGRNNFLYRYPETPIIYLRYGMSELDELIIELLNEEYPNVFVFGNDTDSYNYTQYNLVVQMYYLAKKIADDKGLDLTQPDYNSMIVKRLYRYRGRM